MEAAWTLIPTFIDLAAKKDFRRMEHLFIFYTKIMSIVNTPLCLVLIVMAKPLILLWVGKEFIMSAYLIPIHIIPLFMAIPFAVCSCITYAYAKVKIPSFVSLGVAVLNIFTGILFGVVFSWGLYGIAAGAALSSVIYLTAFFPYYACKVSGISITKYIYHSFIKPFALACAVMGAGFCLTNYFKMELNISLRTLSILTGLFSVYAVLAFVFVLDNFDRKNISEVMKMFFPKGRKQPLDIKTAEVLEAIAAEIEV